MVIKKIPKKIYKVIAGKVILILDIPTEFIIIFSDPFMSARQAKIELEYTINGRVKYIRLRKLSNVSWNIIFRDPFLPVDFLNCSTKSPMNKITAKIKKVKIKE